jgi:hypothetical protein
LFILRARISTMRGASDDLGRDSGRGSRRARRQLARRHASYSGSAPRLVPGDARLLELDARARHILGHPREELLDARQPREVDVTVVSQSPGLRAMEPCSADRSAAERPGLADVLLIVLLGMLRLIAIRLRLVPTLVVVIGGGIVFAVAAQPASLPTA